MSVWLSVGGRDRGLVISGKVYLSEHPHMDLGLRGQLSIGSGSEAARNALQVAVEADLLGLRVSAHRGCNATWQPHTNPHTTPGLSKVV